MSVVTQGITVFFHRFASPKFFYRITSLCQPYLWVVFLICLGFALYSGLFLAPVDYQQGDSYRIMFVHVPAAWMSLFIYIIMAVMAVIAQIWRIKLANILLISSAPIGAGFTFIALVTGSLWGKPMWGTWWVWDARLTSELILLFIYFGIINLHSAIEDVRNADNAAAILVLVGMVNIPIIHYSVEWWNTLHQGPSVSKLDKPSIHFSMLLPLLFMVIAFTFYYLICLSERARLELLKRESASNWVQSLLEQPE